MAHFRLDDYEFHYRQTLNGVRLGFQNEWIRANGDNAFILNDSIQFRLPGVLIGVADLEWRLRADPARNRMVPGPISYNTTPIPYPFNTQVSNPGTGTTVEKATATAPGIVRTNSTSADPVVYLASEVDNLLLNTGTVGITYERGPGTQWVVVHNRGYRPAISCVDHTGEEIAPEIIHVSLNETHIFHQYAQVGTVYLV